MRVFLNDGFFLPGGFSERGWDAKGVLSMKAANDHDFYFERLC